MPADLHCIRRPSGAPARPASPGDDTAHNATSIVPMFIVNREGATQV